MATRSAGGSRVASSSREWRYSVDSRRVAWLRAGEWRVGLQSPVSSLQSCRGSAGRHGIGAGRSDCLAVTEKTALDGQTRLACASDLDEASCPRAVPSSPTRTSQARSSAPPLDWGLETGDWRPPLHSLARSNATSRQRIADPPRSCPQQRDSHQQIPDPPADPRPTTIPHQPLKPPRSSPTAAPASAARSSSPAAGGSRTRPACPPPPRTPRLPRPPSRPWPRPGSRPARSPGG